MFCKRIITVMKIRCVRMRLVLFKRLVQVRVIGCGKVCSLARKRFGHWLWQGLVIGKGKV